MSEAVTARPERRRAGAAGRGAGRKRRGRTRCRRAGTRAEARRARCAHSRGARCRRHALLHRHRGHRQPVVRWHRRLHLPQPGGLRGLQREAPAGQALLQRLRARRGESARPDWAGGARVPVGAGRGPAPSRGPGTTGLPGPGCGGRGASSNPSWRPGPGGNPSRTLSGRLGPEVGGGGFQGEALLPRKQEKMQGLLFHRWGLKVLRGPLTGQVLWAALLVPHFLGLLPRLVRGGSHTINLALL